MLFKNLKKINYFTIKTSCVTLFLNLGANNCDNNSNIDTTIISNGYS